MFQIEVLLNGFMWKKIELPNRVQEDINRMPKNEQRLGNNRLAQIMFRTSGKIHRVVEHV